MDRSEDGFFRYSEGWFERFNARVLCHELGLARERLNQANRELLQRFSDPASYRVLDGAFELLDALGRRGIARVVVSNWSERLPQLLEGLSLSRQLELVLCSAQERTEKPEPELFRRALERVGVAPEEALHAGNDFDKDVRGAASAGILGVLVGPQEAPAGTLRVANLAELRQWIECRS